MDGIGESLSFVVLFSLVGGIPVPGEYALRPLTFEQLSLIFQFGTYWTISLGCAGLNGATVNDNEQRSGARAHPHCTPHSNHPARHFRLLPLTSGVSLPVLSPCLLWAFCHKDDCVPPTLFPFLCWYLYGCLRRLPLTLEPLFIKISFVLFVLLFAYGCHNSTLEHRYSIHPYKIIRFPSSPPR